jgi:hypothetical protein
LLLVRTTWLLGTSNKLLPLLLLLPVTAVLLLLLLLLALQGLQRPMFGPTLRGPSSQALCSS